MTTRPLLCLIALLAACDGPNAVADAGPPDAGPPPPAEVLFDLDGVTDDFFAFPFPSDLRLTDDGTPDLGGFPAPQRLAIVSSLLPIAGARPGWPVVPVAYFRFRAPIAESSADDVIAADPVSSILIVDVDPDSPERGALAPAIAATAPEDGYAGANLLEVATRPGWVLHPNRTYAVVVRRALGDASGAPLEVAPAMATLASGGTPSAAWGARAHDLYAPMFETLATLGVDASEVAAATVFTTGDVVQEGADIAQRALAGHDDVTLDDLHLDPVDGVHDRYCELLGTATLPQFQRGEPPFDTEGLFELDADGAPIEQRTETVPVVVTIPRAEMPASGWPLTFYFHGSGGVPAQLVDRGPRVEGGEPMIGQGPAYVVAEHGFAGFAAALPINPERVPGASDIAYVNLRNMAMTRDLFRQGMIEQRLLASAMTRLTIDEAVLATCTGASLPAGQSAHRFDADRFVAMGQSMGGMYTNLIGPIEPRFRAFVPTGAGGFWSYFILYTSAIPNARSVVASLIGTDAERLTHMHPVMFLLELGLEGVDPMVSAPRISRRPLAGASPRPIYEPVGMGDSYFPTNVYDAMALAYGHRQAGDVVWPEMQGALALAGRDAIVDYPVRDDVTSESGDAYTGVVVQYAGDGFSDPHDIFVQLPQVRYQYGCFFRTAIAGGAVVPAPAPLGTACPE